MSVYDYIGNLEDRIAKAEKRIKYLEDRLSPADAKVKEQNIFHNCDSVGEVIRQAVGAGSGVWIVEGTERVFDTEFALKISKHAEKRIEELIVAQAREQAEAQVPHDTGRTVAYGVGGGGGGAPSTACAHGVGVPGGGGQQ